MNSLDSKFKSNLIESFDNFSASRKIIEIVKSIPMAVSYIYEEIVLPLIEAVRQKEDKTYLKILSGEYNKHI